MLKDDVQMGLTELHTSHIKKVVVGFVISGVNLDPKAITDTLDLQPDFFAARGDERRNSKGALLTPQNEGFWRLDTKGKIQSKDINDHFQYLLSKLLPHQENILTLAEGGETYFDVLWQSTYLYAGTGPVISRECLQGVSQLQASMGFDIYQVDEVEVSRYSCA